MNKGKLIDADELKSRLSTTTSYNLAYTNWVLRLIDELSEDREEPNPLKVAIKGDGTEKYAALLFNYFYDYCIKDRISIDDFIPDIYYHIENGKVVYRPHLLEGYTEISLNVYQEY